jgi:hypothetical protein
MKFQTYQISVRPELVEGGSYQARLWFDKLTTNGGEMML